METITYKKVQIKAQDSILDELLALSKTWANENLSLIHI